MPPKKPRVTLSKAQIQAGLGAELLNLCQSITADGVLTNEEIAELKRWLDANRTADLPAIGFLVETVERILADGKVTKEERAELHAAIEKVLPPETRRDAVSQRKVVEAELKEQNRQQAAAEKEQARLEKERNRPVYSFSFMTAGIYYEGREHVIRRHVAEDDTVYLIRDRGNKFSRNAIEVRLENGMQIGFVPEEDAPDVAPFLNDGHPHIAVISKILWNTRVPIPIVRVTIHRHDATVDGLVYPHQVPRKQLSPYGDDRDEDADDEEEEDDERGTHRRRRARPVSLAKSSGCAGLLLLFIVPAVLVAAYAFGFWC